MFDMTEYIQKKSNYIFNLHCFELNV